MGPLLVGLFGFLAVHSIRIVAPGWRRARIAAMGERTWKGLYSVASLSFFLLLVWGYGQVRQPPLLVWQPPAALRPISYGVLLLAFVLLAAAFVPRNAIRARLQHPMLLGTQAWAFAHLLTVGHLHAVLVFAAFLAWALVALVSARGRPALPSGAVSVPLTALTVALGVAAYVIFALYLHARLVGVAAFG